MIRWNNGTDADNPSPIPKKDEGITSFHGETLNKTDNMDMDDITSNPSSSKIRFSRNLGEFDDTASNSVRISEISATKRGTSEAVDNSFEQLNTYCPNCGRKIEGSSSFCYMCGSAVQNSTEDFTKRLTENISGINNTRKKLPMPVAKIGAVVAALALVIVIVVCGSGRSYKSVVKNYFNSSVKEADAAAIVELIPDECFAYALREEGMTRSYAISELQDELDSQMRSLERYVDSWDMSYKIIDVKSASKDELKYFSADCEDLFGIKVKDRKDVTLEIYVEATKDGETNSDTQELEITVIKVGKDWYLWGVDGQTFEELW